MTIEVAMLIGESLAMVGVLRSYALRRNVIDFPNARSSHQNPTPRGGGLPFTGRRVFEKSAFEKTRGAQGKRWTAGM